MSFDLSKELFINLKEKDIPKWEEGIPFYDQNIDVIQFWMNEMDKVTNGLNIGGYFVAPWLYYHINFFKTLIPDINGGNDIITNPPLDDNFLYVIESYEEAREKGLGLCLFGTRGFAKSTILGSNALWTLTKNTMGGLFDITGGSSKDLDDINLMIKTSLNNMVEPMRIPVIKENDKIVDFGAYNKSNEPYVRGRIRLINADPTKESSSEKGAGGTPCGYIVDEIGKFDPRKILKSAEPAFKSQYGARFVHILSGTGGNNELSEGARFILENPKSYSLLPVNFDRLDRNVPEECITWKEDRDKKFCTFVPAQMSYRNGCPKIKTTLSDFLDIKSDELDSIFLYKTDWINATKIIQDKIDIQASQEDKNRETMYFPTKIDDCFLVENDNPFPVDRCAQLIRKIEEEQNYRVGRLERGIDEKGIIFKEEARPIVAGRRYENKPIDSPFIFYGDIPEEIPPGNYYVSGLDDYNLAQSSDTDSLGSFYVLKRAGVDIDTPIEIIACSLATRPKEHKKFHSDLEIAITKYNAICCMEGANLNFADFFLSREVDPLDYLAKSFSPQNEILTKGGKKRKLNSIYGIYPTPANTKYIINTVVNYANKEVLVGLDENGKQVYKKGVDFIPDPLLLKEMIDYSAKGGNYDRIIAFGHALVYARKLDRENILPDDVIESLKKINKKDKKYNHTSKFVNFSNSKIKYNNYNIKK